MYYSSPEDRAGSRLALLWEDHGRGPRPFTPDPFCTPPDCPFFSFLSWILLSAVLVSFLFLRSRTHSKGLSVFFFFFFSFPPHLSKISFSVSVLETQHAWAAEAPALSPCLALQSTICFLSSYQSHWSTQVIARPSHFPLGFDSSVCPEFLCYFRFCSCLCEDLSLHPSGHPNIFPP